MAEWSAECSSDSDCENFLMALREQFKSKDLAQVLSNIHSAEDKLECMKSVKRKKWSKRMVAIIEPSRQEQDTGASDTTPSEMRSPLSTSSREPQNIQQQQRFAENTLNCIHLAGITVFIYLALSYKLTTNATQPPNEFHKYLHAFNHLIP